MADVWVPFAGKLPSRRLLSDEPSKPTALATVKAPLRTQMLFAFPTTDQIAGGFEQVVSTLLPLLLPMLKE